MEISKAAIGVFAVACVAGAAGGSYVATRGAQPASAALQEAADVTLEPDASGPGPSDRVVPVEPVTPMAAPAAASPPRPPAPTPRPSAQPARPPQSASAPPREAGPEDVIEPLEAQPAVLPPLAYEPTPWVPPAGPVYHEVVVVRDSVIGLQLDTDVSSETARLEDTVLARVARDVRVGERVAIPAGSRAEGTVTLVERGGRVRERARLGVRFTSVLLADGTRLPMQTEVIFREGDSPGTESAAKIGGGAIGGAIIGGILGGAKGAAIGGSAGAGAGTTAVLVGGRNPAVLPAGTHVTVRVEQPITVLVED